MFGFVGLSRGCFVGLTRGFFFTLNFSKFWKDIVLLFFGHFVNVHIKEICGKTAEFDDSETIWSSSFSTKSLFDEFFSGAGNKWGSPTWLCIMSSNMFPSTSLKKSSTEKKEIEKLSQRMRKTSLTNAISRQILLWSYFFFLQLWHQQVECLQHTVLLFSWLSTFKLRRYFNILKINYEFELELCFSRDP